MAAHEQRKRSGGVRAPSISAAALCIAAASLAASCSPAEQPGAAGGGQTGPVAECVEQANEALTRIDARQPSMADEARRLMHDIDYGCYVADWRRYALELGI